MVAAKGWYQVRVKRWSPLAPGIDLFEDQPEESSDEFWPSELGKEVPHSRRSVLRGLLSPMPGDAGTLCSVECSEPLAQ
eukprot:2132446-Amphidinium_carterae.1